MNIPSWQQYWEANKSKMDINEATMRYRLMERKKNDEEYEQWLHEAVARGGGAAASASGFGGGAGGGSTAVGAALLAPSIVADASPNVSAIVYYWGTAVHANQYVVQRATNSAFTTGVTTIYTGNSPAQVGQHGFVDNNLPHGTTFYYRVKAQDTTATYLDSPYGPVASATTISGSNVYGLGLGVDNL